MQLAEDNELNREIVVELLSMFNITAVCAVNGREAVERFEADPPGTYALILMDIQMPVMNGYEAASRIRKSTHPQAGSSRIIAMSANSFSDDVHAALESGMNAHVGKPIDMDVLAGVLSAISF